MPRTRRWNVSQEKLEPNTEQNEKQAFVKPTGFREYDARWLFPDEINQLGVQALGMGIATQLKKSSGTTPRIVVGHDYRSYSATVKQALTVGMLSSGAKVYDIGVCITPMAYFARSFLKAPGVGMVTASHNKNGWTGVKVGDVIPITHGPDEMSELKRIVFAGEFAQGTGKYIWRPDVFDRYVRSLSKMTKLGRPLKVVCACGNGTASMFAPKILKSIGCKVVPQNCKLDWTFPNYNPNPENIGFAKALKKLVIESKADLGVGFDGDGDRIGVIDNTGELIFADRLGLLIARHLCQAHPNSHFVVDVKSTSLFANDAVLKANNSDVEYWKTGHSYIKRRVNEIKALAGFEKSGHFFFSPPFGGGYDDAMVSAILVCQLLDRQNKSLSQLLAELPKTWQSPTMGPECPDEVKYDVVKRVTEHYSSLKEKGELIAGQPIKEIITINGARVVLQDGTWGLIRASSNIPSLVVVVESPTSEAAMRAMFKHIDEVLRRFPEVGQYDQGLDG